MKSSTKDMRVFHCKYCGERQSFDVNNENQKSASEFWDEWHSGCRKRIEEQSIIKAMTRQDKSLYMFTYVYTEEELKGKDI